MKMIYACVLIHTYVATLQMFWEIKSTGIEDFPSKLLESNLFFNIMFKNGCFWFGLPWKSTYLGVADHLILREIGLKSLLCQLQSHPEKFFYNMITYVLKQAIVE